MVTGGLSDHVGRGQAASEGTLTAEVEGAASLSGVERSGSWDRQGAGPTFPDFKFRKLAMQQISLPMCFLPRTPVSSHLRRKYPLQGAAHEMFSGGVPAAVFTEFNSVREGA